MSMSANAGNNARPQRRASRAAVQLSANMHAMGMLRRRVDLCDVSVLGFRIRTTRTLTPDACVWLTIPRLEPVLARIVRQNGSEVGGEFVSPLPPALFDALIGQAAG